MTIVAGVDAGGSHTVAVIGDLSGSELGRFTGAHANAATSGPSLAAATIAAAVRNALDQTAFATPVASLEARPKLDSDLPPGLETVGFSGVS